MTDLFFYIFAALTLGSALCVTLAKSPVNGAMFLITTFVGMASLFVLLEAYFLAVIQILVYAGAVVVLFLFIIMLLDVGEEKKSKTKLLTWIASFVGFALLIVGVVGITSSSNIQTQSDALPEAAGASLKNFGYELFTTYQLPMQVTGFLLLIAMIGVIVLSKRVKTD